MEEGKIEYEEISPNIWKPTEEGDTLEGVYISKEEGKGDFGSNSYLVENATGQVMFWGSAVIDERMKFCKISDRIKIVYKGTVKNKKNQDVKIFKVLRAVGLSKGAEN